MRILILTRIDDASPKVLAISLKNMLERQGVKVDVSFRINILKRMNNHNYLSSSLGLTYLRIKNKLKYFIKDLKFIRDLKAYDAVIISECTPNSFWLDYYAIEKLKLIISPKPVVLYEVYFLGNTPYQINKLLEQGNPTIERYYWHLAVAEVTEIHAKPKPPWSCIGLDLKSMGLKPSIKKEFFAIVDFKQPGYEKERRMQIKALEFLKIPYISFSSRMPMEEIRDYYKRASLIFVQSPEAFGLPIAECLSYGTAVFTKEIEWVMSWRILNTDIINKFTLPECFYVYNNYERLVKQLEQLREEYHQKKTPITVFNTFIANYPHFYEGDDLPLKDFLKIIKKNQFN